MEALFNFLLQEDEPGESFDPRAARPRCKVCGADAWLQWDGRYADYCSRSCRDKQAGSQGLVPALGPLKPSQRREGGAGGGPNMLGERQAQLLQEKEDKWERQFSPRNRYLPRKKAQTQEQDPGQQQQRAEGRGSAAAAAARALAEAAAAKKVARALRQRIPPKVAPRRPSGPRMEGGPPSVASTPRKMLSIISRGSDENLPLQRQRTVARFVEQGENAAELQTALKEYQENLNRERQKLEEERTAAVVADAGNVRRLATAATTAADGDAGRLRRSATAATAAAAAAKATTELQRREAEASVELLQRERAKYEEQMRAIREESEQQLQQHKAQLVSEVKRIAAEELDAQKALEKELGEVRASLQQLKKQQEQQRQQQQLLLQNELEQHLRAQLQQDLEQQLERKLRDKLQEELRQELQQELQRKQEQLEGRDGVGRVEGRRSKEHLLRQELLEQQLHQEKRLQQQLLEQQRQQEKLLYQLRQQEQTLQRLAAAAGPGSSASRPQRPSSRGGEITADQQLRDLLLQGLFSCLKMHDSQQQQHKQKQQQQQQPETLEASSWAERELALRDAKAAEAAAAAEAKGNHIIGPYEGRLEAAVVEANLQLPDPMEQQHGLRFGSKLQVVFRVATGPGEWEEKETSFSADGQWGETLSFSVHWPSAGVAAASAVLYAQLWATMNSNTASTGPCSSSCRYFVGEAALPLPTFTSLWEYRAPLRWRSSLGGNTQQQLLLQQGNLLLRVQFYPAEKAQAPVASTEKPEDLHALLPTSDVTTELPSNPNNCRGSTKGGASSHCSRSSDSRSTSRNSSGIGNHSEKQLQPEKLLRDISEGDSTLQQQLLQQLEELSLAWRRALNEQELQQKQPQNRIPVVIDSQLLQEHLQRSPMMGALCTNSFCSNLVGAFSDLYSEEEFRVWGLCSSCQQQLFTTPLPAGRRRGRTELQLLSPFAHCCKDIQHELGFTEALARAEALREPLPFGELRLDGKIPVAFPTPNCLWPSALQLLHAQRFSLVSIQERLRSCSCSGELLALLQSPLLQRFERPDWHCRAAAAVRTCLLLLLQQHPKLQLLLSSLGGCYISYHDPLQLRLMRRMKRHPKSESESTHTLDKSGPSKAPSLRHNLAGLLLMDLCAALGPPIYE